MSDFDSRLPARPSLEQLQKQSKELLRQYRAGDEAAVERFRAVSQRFADPRHSQMVILADAQFVVAREHGFPSWAKLKLHIEAGQSPNRDQYEKLAKDLVRACQGDAEALQHLNDVFGNAFTRAGNPFSTEQLRANVQEWLSAISGSARQSGDITLADAQLFVARQYGFESWAKLVESMTQSAEEPHPASHGSSSTPPFYRINRKENTIEPGPLLSETDWNTVFAVMNEQGITGLNAGGRMTDAALERLSRLDHITRLDLGGSIQLTDTGLAHLKRLPRLQELDLSGPKGLLTDHGLEVLRDLPELRRFQMCWQQNVSDAGIAHLSRCDHLESVDLLGTPTGDGAIGALSGKRNLRRFKTGRSVTDAGLGHFHRFPMFKTWQGGDVTYGLMSADAGPTHLLVDGPFTDEGLASLAGLDGLFALSFFWHCPRFTAKGLEPLKDLGNLGFLGCQGERCNDEAMLYISTMPRLRMLMAQGTVASDAGFTH